MIQRQLKLRLNKNQESVLITWINNLTGVWNFAVRKIELDAKNNIYHTPEDFQNLLAGHGTKMGIPSHTIQGILLSAHVAWKRCFKGLARKPHLKGLRNKLNSIPFPDPLSSPQKN